MSDESIDNALRPKQLAFLEAYRRIGVVSIACKEIGISRNAHYNWLEEDGGYVALFENAKDKVSHVLEDALYQRAITGWLEPVFHKGKVVGTVRKFSDTCLLTAVKASMPEKYRERIDNHNTGSQSVKIEVTYANDLAGTSKPAPRTD